MFTDARALATKIMIPIDADNLKFGARTVYVGQRDWLRLLQEGTLLDPVSQARDITTLKLIDQLPGFDPFLMREWLARGGVEADDAFFELKPEDLLAMEDFAAREVSGLAAVALGAGAPVDAVRALAMRLMSGEHDRGFDGVQAAMKLEEEAFQQAMFAWKGFVYYKWVRADLGAHAARALIEIDTALPGPKVKGRDAELARERGAALKHAVELAGIQGDKILKAYDQAYSRISRKNEPGPFLAFLQEAPMQFMKLGHAMGVLSHVGRTWREEADRLGHGVRMAPTRLADFLDDMATTIRFEDIALFA